MTTTATAPAPVAAAPEPKGKGKKPLIMVVVAVLVLAGAGYFFFLRPSGEAAVHEPVPGPVVDLEPLTLNLADGRFLKVGLSLQLTEEAASGHGEEGVNGAKARDAAIGIFGQRTYAQLLAPKGREAARKALDAEVKHRYEGEVIKVYLTEFVMQ
jgi:flagellar FliL protein